MGIIVKLIILLAVILLITGSVAPVTDIISSFVRPTRKVQRAVFTSQNDTEYIASVRERALAELQQDMDRLKEVPNGSRQSFSP